LFFSTLRDKRSLMKKTFLLGLFVYLISTHVSWAQDTELPVDPETKKITYTEVVQIDAKTSQGTVYDRALAWAISNKYKVTKMDKANGVFGCEGSINITYPGPRVGMNDNGFIKFDITITSKGGRYKYIMTNFRHEGHKGKGNGGALELAKAECGKYVLPDNGWFKIKKDAPALVNKIITDLKVSIEPQSTPPAKKEDW
jgi:hypothetical protein